MITELLGSKSYLREQVQRRQKETLSQIEGLKLDSTLGNQKAKDMTPLELLNILTKVMRVISK